MWIFTIRLFSIDVKKTVKKCLRSINSCWFFVFVSSKPLWHCPNDSHNSNHIFNWRNTSDWFHFDSIYFVDISLNVRFVLSLALAIEICFVFFLLFSFCLYLFYLFAFFLRFVCHLDRNISFKFSIFHN